MGWRSKTGKVFFSEYQIYNCKSHIVNCGRGQILSVPPVQGPHLGSFIIWSDTEPRLKLQSSMCLCRSPSTLMTSPDCACWKTKAEAPSSYDQWVKEVRTWEGPDRKLTFTRGKTQVRRTENKSRVRTRDQSNETCWVFWLMWGSSSVFCNNILWGRTMLGEPPYIPSSPLPWTLSTAPSSCCQCRMSSALLLWFLLLPMLETLFSAPALRRQTPSQPRSSHSSPPSVSCSAEPLTGCHL